MVTDAAASFTPTSVAFGSLPVKPVTQQPTQHCLLSAADLGVQDQGNQEDVNPEYVSQQGTDQHQDADQQCNHQQQDGQPEVEADYVTAAIKQDLLTSVEEFFQQEVAPRTTAIAQVALQQRAIP